MADARTIRNFSPDEFDRFMSKLKSETESLLSEAEFAEHLANEGLALANEAMKLLSEKFEAQKSISGPCLSSSIFNYNPSNSNDTEISHPDNDSKRYNKK